jgi:hypothetical protein
MADFNLFVGASNKERVLFIVIGIESHTVGIFLIRECSHNFSSFRVPIMNESIIGRAQEMESIIREVNITDRFFVSSISSHALLIIINIPELHLAIERSTQ